MSLRSSRRTVAPIEIHRPSAAVWAWPWAGSLGLLAVGALLHEMWAGNVWAAVGVTLATAGLTLFAHAGGRARGAIVRMHAAATVAASGMWLLAAVIVGPGTRPVIDCWVALALIGGLSWNLRRGLRGDGTDGSSGGWDSLGERVRLAGSRVHDVTESGPRVSAKVTVQRGAQTAADVAAAKERIASAVGVPASGVRVVPDPDDAGRARLTLVTRDLLRQPIPWPGLSQMGQSIAEPIMLGLREDGSPLQLWLPADERAGRTAVHVLVAGQTGSGKSVAGRLVAAEVLARVDAELWVVDTVKGAQFVRPFRDRLHRVATTTDEAKALIGGLPALIAQRADALGQLGHDNWRPDSGMPYVVVLVEEAASVIATSRPFVRAAQTGRSAGVSLVVSLQRPTHHNLPVDARQQMGAVLQFGCRPGDERYGLSPATLDAGAAPQRWGNSRPGYVYGEVPGVSEELWASPARTYLVGAADVSSNSKIIDDVDNINVIDDLGGDPDVIRVSATPEQAKRAFLDRLHELRDAGETTIRPADFAAVRESTGRSAAWITGALSKVVDAGGLEQNGRGVYRFKARG